jgi:hypothetical protein
MGKKQPKAAYVVRKGRQPGIYLSWEECEAQVLKYPGARFQGYLTEKEAQAEWAACQIAEVPVLHSDLVEQRKPLLNVQPNRNLDLTALTPTAVSSKRSSSFIDLTEDDDDEPVPKRQRIVDLTSSSDDVKNAIAKNTGSGGEPLQYPSLIKVELEDELELQEPPIQLTPAQQAVVNLAWNGHNLFLTGAAGSGKTATLKAIIRLLEAKYRPPTGETKGGNAVEIVAPTGIAALPLNGKTTFSFAGWWVLSLIYAIVEFVNATFASPLQISLVSPSLIAG